MTRVTLNNVNKALEAKGVAERLVKGKDYFYFEQGNAHKWETSMVYTMHLTDLTVDGWVAEHAALAATYEEPVDNPNVRISETENFIRLSK